MALSLLVDKGEAHGLFHSVKAAVSAADKKKLSDDYGVFGTTASDLEPLKTKTILSLYNSINIGIRGARPLVKFQSKSQGISRLIEIIDACETELLRLGGEEGKPSKKRKSSGNGKVFMYPKEGSKTREIWDTCDKMKNKTAGEIFKALTAKGHNPNTVRTQYNRWKKHHEAKSA